MLSPTDFDDIQCTIGEKIELLVVYPAYERVCDKVKRPICRTEVVEGEQR